VILELTSPKQAWRRLKHNFRVTIEITLARMNDTLLAPSAALFRHGDGWAVFVAKQGRARLRPVEVGLGSETFTEVSQGLDDGDWVILYPDERITDDARVAARVES